MAVAALRYDPVEKNVFIKDSTGKDMAWVEAIVKAYEPDIVVLDMGDKFAAKTRTSQTSISRKQPYMHVTYPRNTSVQSYGCHS